MLRKDIESFEKRTNIYVYTTVTTVFVTFAIILFRLLLGWRFDPVEALLYGIVFWVVFFLTTKFILRTAKRRK